jgi:mRNA interferase MazF
MGRFVKGEVVVVPFPFSDLTDTKDRPALVVAQLRGSDLILCQITSVNRGDEYSITLSASDFVFGSLPVASFIRANRVFTGDSGLIKRTAGRVSQKKLQEVIDKLVEILNSQT